MYYYLEYWHQFWPPHFNKYGAVFKKFQNGHHESLWTWKDLHLMSGCKRLFVFER